MFAGILFGIAGVFRKQRQAFHCRRGIDLLVTLNQVVVYRQRAGLAGPVFKRGHDIAAELGLYVIHGLLHLCGYDDHSSNEVKKMRERERHYLRALDYPEISEE